MRQGGCGSRQVSCDGQTELLPRYAILGQFFASRRLSFLICKMGLILPPSHRLGVEVGGR